MKDDRPAPVRLGFISAEDYATILDCVARADKESYAMLAKRLCCGNVPLFGHLFFKHKEMPHLWPQWKEIEDGDYDKVMIRVFRGGGKTALFTTAKVLHDVCYSTVKGSGYEDTRLLCVFATTPRAKERMETIKGAFEDNEMLRLAFGDIKAMARTWGDLVINLPHPSGRLREDPVLKCATPKTKTLGMHPSVIIGDDIVDPDEARYDGQRARLRSWWDNTIAPMAAKSGVKVFLPHTPFHEDDLNMNLERSQAFRLIKIPWLNRVPEAADCDFVYRDGVLRDVTLTPQGKRRLKSAWPCPVGPDWDCAGKKCKVTNGYHRPLKEALMEWRENPRRFYSQGMLMIQAPDSASIRRDMLRFYVRNPNDPRVGKVSKHHEDMDWGSRQPPTIKAFPDAKDIAYSVHAWDFAYGKKRTSDKTCLCRLYRSKDGYYFAAFHAGRWGRDLIVKKVVGYAQTDDVGSGGKSVIRKPEVVAVEGGGQQSFWEEDVDRLLREQGIRDNFKLRVVQRTKDKDTMFVESLLPNAMGEGLIYVDEDDDEAVHELLSITADESSAHDDRFDALVNAYPHCRHAKPALRLGPKSGSALLSC